MMRIGFNRRFVNEAGDDLIPGKIHTVRANYEYWKRFEGRDVALFYWEGKPYRSKQRVFCVKRIVRVQKVIKETDFIQPGCDYEFFLANNSEYRIQLLSDELAGNDGLTLDEFNTWFKDYPDGQMGILHFTDFRY
jgi:hypothetical protein